MSKREKWDEAYQDADFVSATPVKVLIDNEYLLPEKALALDLACGRAGNALYLAKMKSQYEINAIDFSSVVIRSLKKFVTSERLPINCILRDVENEGLQDVTSHVKYDVIVVSYFLNRALFPQIIDALKPGGLLFYQTWSQEKVDNSGPSNPKFRLKQSELLSLCAGLIPLVYREDGSCGDLTKGLRNEAMIVARKPLSL